ncbi:MAG: hypothetical protein ABSC55_10015, partial [Syntrophorhabdales bacterium]
LSEHTAKLVHGAPPQVLFISGRFKFYLFGAPLQKLFWTDVVRGHSLTYRPYISFEKAGDVKF